MKHETDQPSLGLILCKSKNNVLAEYTLRDMTKPIGLAEYRLQDALPSNIQTVLPTIEELESELSKDLQEEEESDNETSTKTTSHRCDTHQSMITIDLLKNHPDMLPRCAEILHELIGRIWMPEIGIEEIESLYHEELKQDMPLTYIAFNGAIPVGSCTLQLNEDIRPDLGPWISDLVVDSKYQKQGIGKMLIDVVVKKAKELGFKKLYLFAFDPTIPEYYGRLGWQKIGMDEFKSHPVTVMEVLL